MLRCTLSDYEAIVTVSLNQPAYKTYANFLPAYMAAYRSQRNRSIMLPYHPLQWSSSDPTFSSSLPDVTVSFPKVPTSELLETMRAQGGRELTVKGTKVFIIPEPQPAMLRAILAGGASRTTPAAVNSVNIDALSTLSLVRRIFSNFFFTHQYPAFIDDDHIHYVEDHWRKDEGFKRKRLAFDDESGGPSKQARGADQESVAHMEVGEEEQSEESIPMGDKIINAIAPTKIDIAWGDDRVLPQGQGLFVRYIAETQNFSGEKAIHNTLVRYFLGLLGESADAVRTAFNRVKKDLGVLVMTDTGKELAHIARCIDLGLQAQARIWPLISDGQYLGCVLLGAGFHISSYGTVYAPVTSEALLQNIERAGSHRSSLVAIANIVEEDVNDTDYQEVMNVQSMTQLRMVLYEKPLSSEDRDRICTVARGLRFKPKSLNVSSDNIIGALHLIKFPEEPLPTMHPIHPDVLFDNNRVAVVWSAFGDLAPSCNFPGGPQVNLDSAKDLPKHIGFRLVPLKDAVIDIDTIMSQKKFSNSNLNRRSGVYKDRLYTGNDAAGILSALTFAAGVMTDKGKKKTVGTGDVDPGLFDDGF